MSEKVFFIDNLNLFNYRGGISIKVNNEIINKNFLDLLEKIPEKYIQYKNQRDGDSYHLTVISHIEQFDKKLLDEQISSIKSFSIEILGLGMNENCYYLICVSSQLDNLRKNLGLIYKDFHITLGFNYSDKHNISKGIDSIQISLPNIISSTLNNLSNDFIKNINLLNNLIKIYPDNFLIRKNLINELGKNGNYNEAIAQSKIIITTCPDNIQSYYMYLLLAIKTDSYDLEFIRSLFDELINISNIKISKYGLETVKMLNDISIKFELFPYELDTNFNEKYKWFKLVKYNLSTNSIEKIIFNGLIDKNIILKLVDNIFSAENYIMDFIDGINEQIILNNPDPNKTIYIYCEDSTKLNNYIKLELPCNFSKIESKNYGSGIVSPRHIYPLSVLKINTIINLIGEEKPKEEVVKLCENYKIKLYHFGFPDRTACGFDLYLKIQEIITNPDNNCLVHCMGGIGRTNMVLCGQLMSSQSISPAESIAILKKSRKVIMVPEQVLFLKKYYGYLNNLSNGSDQMQNIQLPLGLKGLIIMMGLPCSGKSTLALEIYSKYSSVHNNIIHINQDEIGKSGCEELLSSQAKTADLIILDRCNPTELDRIGWIKMYRGLTSNKITILFLNLGLDLSLKRLPERKNHLTLGTEGSKIIIDMNKKISKPNKTEGWDELIEINSLEELNDYKNKIGLGSNLENQLETTNNIDKIIKFPRTKHLMNLGAMTRDDLLMDKVDIETMLKGEITVEEKIDGANLGFRLGPNNKIIAQNRSHYVCSSSHPQFKKLDQWIESHKKDLMKILQSHNYIIYGEWLYSKHSIFYTKLPDYFVMFDLYDINTKSFFSRDYVENILTDTSISLVPLLFKGKTTSDKLKSLVQTESKFYSGPVEGVYIRSFDSNKLKFRAKIVRADFISGDEHWTKGKQITNVINF